MILKTTSLLTSVCVAVLCVLSLELPNDPYFNIISSNDAAVISRVILAGLLVNLAFQKRFKRACGHICYGALALILVSFGLSGILISSIEYELFNYIKLLDFVFMTQVGILFALAALSYERGTKPLPRLSRPRNWQPRLFSRAT